MAVHDPIYGYFVLPPALQQAVAHPAFQRLHGIAQLGFAGLVPGGECLRHSRAEHCQGVAYLAGVAAVALKLSEEETLLVQMAGLLHDVGHGPYSHAFEKVSPVRHEEQSQEISELISERFWPREWVITVRYLIDPKGPPPTPQALKLRDLIANKHCHVDIDKLDYLLRDSYYAGKTFVPVARVVEFFYHSRLSPEGRWEFHESQRPFLRQVFEHREDMFETVYQRSENKRLECQMIKAAKMLKEDWRDLRVFLAHTDTTFLALIAQTPEGQRLLRGDCDILPAVVRHPDPQAPATVMVKIPFYDGES
jgi:HD superfamily phosphohydrolase